MVFAFSRSAQKGENRSPEVAATSVGSGALDLTSLADGEAGRVVGFTGSSEAVGKLESMGILEGSVIEKKSAAMRHGPIVVARGGTQLALAYGIARGILVEPVR
jgi:Fe2+ transport system protein FeoA